MPSQKLEFAGHDGQMLAGRLDLPTGPVRACAIFAHCFTCSKDLAATKRISGRLAALGVAVLRFDFTGLGHSEGEFANTSFSTNIGDLAAAADHLRQTHGAPQLLIGHSLGGAAVLAAASLIPDAKAVVTIGAPHDPEHVLHNFESSVEEIRREGSAKVSLAGRSFTISREFLEDVTARSLDEGVSSLRKALLVLHSPIDATVGVENAAAIFTAAKHPKSFISLDNADHLLTRVEDATYAADVIAAWAARYLEMPTEDETASHSESDVMVTEADPAGFRQDVLAGRHRSLADEPKSVGGTDEGMTPYQFVSAGLGACTSMTIRMYARRKKIPLEKVSVTVDHDKIHAADCEACETKDGKVDVFRRRILLEGDLDEAQRARLMEIADRCPVHRTLEGEIRIETTLA